MNEKIIKDMGLKLVLVLTRETFLRRLVVSQTGTLALRRRAENDQLYIELGEIRAGTVLQVLASSIQAAGDSPGATRLRAMVDNTPETLDPNDETALFSAPYTLVIDDPAGSSVFGSDDPRTDPFITECYSYARSRAQNIALGLVPQEQIDASARIEDAVRVAIVPDASLLDRYASGPAVTTVGECSSCGYPEAEQRLTLVNPPEWKPLLVVSCHCRLCLHHDALIKSPGQVPPPRGKQVTLRVRKPADLRRLVLKSDYCSLEIPELGLEGSSVGAMGTVGAILRDMRDQLQHSVASGMAGAGAGSDDAWATFFDRFDQLQSLKGSWSLILKDPLGNSFVGPSEFDDLESESALTIEDYERSAEEEERLGIADLERRDELLRMMMDDEGLENAVGASVVRGEGGVPSGVLDGID